MNMNRHGVRNIELYVRLSDLRTHGTFCHVARKQVKVCMIWAFVNDRPELGRNLRPRIA